VQIFLGAKMIIFNDKELSQNQVAKVLLKAAVDVARENMTEEFKKASGLNTDCLTKREQAELEKSLRKWCDRLEKTLNINFEYSSPKASEEDEEIFEYFQLKSGGFAAKGYYSE